MLWGNPSTNGTRTMLSNRSTDADAERRDSAQRDRITRIDVVIDVNRHDDVDDACRCDDGRGCREASTASAAAVRSTANAAATTNSVRVASGDVSYFADGRCFDFVSRNYRRWNRRHGMLMSTLSLFVCVS